MTVSILGCGWYGWALGKELVNKGFTVKGSTTSLPKISLLAADGIEPFVVNLADDKQLNSAFFDCDVLWICISPRTRAGLGAGYLKQIKNLFALLPAQKIKHVVLISSTGVYGDDNTEVNELSYPQPDSESGKILLSAETLLQQQDGFTKTIIRFGGLIGPGRDPGRFFSGKTDIPNGEAPVNLIHLSDCIGISLAILNKNAFGNIYNAVSPEHPTRNDFYTKAAERSGLELPQFINEKNDWKIVQSVNVPAQLQYAYKVGLYN